MHRYRSLVAACLGLLLVAGVPAAAAGPARILVLGGKDAPPYRAAIEGFRNALHEQGVAARQDVRFFGDDEGQGRTLVAAAVGRGDRLILALGAAATTLACEQSQVPVVATMMLDDQAIRSVANATGVPIGYSTETELKWLQRFLPDKKRVGVLYNAGQNEGKIAEARIQARELGLDLVAQEVDTAKQLPDALKSLANRVDVLWGVADRVVLTPQTARAILLFSFRNRIPFAGLSQAWVKAGALYSLERDYTDLGAQSAGMAAKILKGTAVAAVPPEPPRRVLYSLNLKTAERVKVHILDEVVRAAKKVYD